MKKAKFRHVRLLIAYLLMILGALSIFGGWHFSVFLLLSALIWFTNYLNDLHYSYNLEYINHVIGNILIGVLLDWSSEYKLFTLSIILSFPAQGGIRNRFPFWVGINKALWIEKTFWFLALIIYGLAIYLNPWKWQYLAFFLLGFTFATIYTWIARGTEAKAYIELEKKERGVEPGDKAIEFELPDQHGNIVRLKDFYGKSDILLLFVRGDWCPACHIMLRTYYKYREKFKEKGIFFIAIGPDPQGVNKEMLERIGADFVILSDENLKITNQYGVKGDGQIAINDFEGIPLPAAFIIDKKGIIRYNTRPETPGSFLRPDSILAVLEGLQLDISTQTYEETYETIVQQANDGILVLDIVEGKILNANQFLLDLLGYASEDLKQKTVFQIIPKTFLNESAKQIADAWEHKGAIFRMQLLTQSLEIIPTECSAKVIAFGKHSALVLYIRDIRERIKMENQIIDQSRIIEQKNKDILDSIEYAKRIQTATLPPLDQWFSFASQAFIYYEPRDIVSGDFYWLNLDEDQERVYFALGDCTGHGVPGAFMSMLAINQLNRIIDDLNIKQPLKIIQTLDVSIQKALKQEKGGNDGLDCAFFMYDKKLNIIQFVLAGRPLLYRINDKTLTEVKADKYPIGGISIYSEKVFQQHEIKLQKGESIQLFLYSDGIVDQMGGPQRRKFGSKRLRTFLESQIPNSLEIVFKTLKEDFEEWKKTFEQLDDVTLMMLEIKA